jgi:hypothetical protein
VPDTALPVDAGAPASTRAHPYDRCEYDPGFCLVGDNPGD